MCIMKELWNCFIRWLNKPMTQDQYDSMMAMCGYVKKTCPHCGERLDPERREVI